MVFLVSAWVLIPLGNQYPVILSDPQALNNSTSLPRQTKNHNTSSMLQKHSGIYLKPAQSRDHRNMTWQKGDRTNTEWLNRDKEEEVLHYFTVGF